CINSATERPSRAPSTTKSLISAMASGWLSLTPRSRRLRATMAATAISSLSFSRGVRFIAASLQPEPRHAVPERGQHGDQIAAQGGAVARHQPRQRKPVPSRNAGFACELERAHGGDGRLVGRRDQHTGDGNATGGDGAVAELVGNGA